jgi:hypothetical protein
MKKNLLKSTLVAAIMLIMGSANAQMTFFGRTGLNLNDLVLLDGEGKTVEIYKTGIGIQLGGGVDFEINDQMGVEVGLGYSQRGASVDNTIETPGLTATTTGSMTLHYIDLPVSFRYSSNMGSGRLNFGFGPKIGLGLSGTEKYTTKVTSMGVTQESTAEESVSFGDGKTSSFKTIDLSIGTSVSFEISNIHFGVQYYYGMTNHLGEPTDKESVSQNMASIIVGYRFGR